MQNSNPSPVPFPFCLDETLARAYARAREACAGAEPSSTDIYAAYTAGQPQAQTNGHDPGASAGRLDVGELIDVLRGPIEWVFTLAERRAQGEPVDLAAIHRVREAIRFRLDSTIAGDGASEDRPRIRATDLLTVASLLVGTLDPAVVQRAALGVGGSIANALATVLQLDRSLATYVAQTAASIVSPRAPRRVASFHCCVDGHLAL
ncbi:MAG TPA: hypothetical protein VF469_04590 [Kofleriaceae bacterium]